LTDVQRVSIKSRACSTLTLEIRLKRGGFEAKARAGSPTGSPLGMTWLPARGSKTIVELNAN
jgi:hypothetical protein